MWIVGPSFDEAGLLIIGFGNGESFSSGNDGNYGENITVIALGFGHDDIFISCARTGFVTVTTTTSGSSDEEVGAGASSSKKGKQKKGSSKKPTGGKVRLTPTDPGWPKDVPDTFPTCEKDWRTEGVLREEVTNQGTLELCWAVSLRESIEAALNVKAKSQGRDRHLRLSAQHLVNNVSKLKDGAMRRYEGVTRFLVDEGLVTEDLCEFTGTVHNGCNHATPNPEEVTKIRGLIRLKGNDINEEEIIKLVAKRPVMIEMKAFDSFTNFKGDGIYRGPNCKEEEKQNYHALLLVGFGTLDGVHYWIVKNSYGTVWGDDGYGKVIRQRSRESNAPSLIMRVRYPVV